MRSPCAFTENGAIMVANVLNCPEAVRMSVIGVRAFMKMRELVGGTKELARQHAELERGLIGRLRSPQNYSVIPCSTKPQNCVF